MRYCVYIMASIRRVLYIGVSGRLDARVAEHKAKLNPDAFTARYNVTRLVYVEWFDRIELAIAREKQIKGWRRDRKIHLIEKLNPGWVDYSEAPPFELGQRRIR